MFNKRVLGLLLLITLTFGVIGCSKQKNRIELYHSNGQTGLIVDQKSDVTIDEKTKKLYKTSSEDVILSFEVMDLDKGHDNHFMINDTHIIPIAFQGYDPSFYKVSLTISGLNIQDGKLNLKAYSGVNELGNHDTFLIRSLTITHKKTEYWPSMFPKEEYFNEAFKLGGPNLKSNYRFGYSNTISLDYVIPLKQLDTNGILLEQAKDYQVSVGKTVKKLINDAYLSYEINVVNNETILNSRSIYIDTDVNHRLFLDDVEIQNNFSLSQRAWSHGEHKLDVVLSNEYGFIKHDQFRFTLGPVTSEKPNQTYVIYDHGMVDDLLSYPKKTANQIEQSHTSPFAKYGVVTIETTHKKGFEYLFYQGDTLENRTTYMQVYNHLSKQFDTVSVQKKQPSIEITHGFDYLGKEDKYLNNNIITWRVVSENIMPLRPVSEYIYHVTDVQYIAQKMAQAEGTLVGDEAVGAMKNMSDYLIESSQNNQLQYSVMTGDFTQTLRNTHKEYGHMMTNFFNPLLESRVRFGVLAGNHDIGAVSENINGGGQALDENLYYDVFNQYLGAHQFEDFEHFIEATENNKSHLDRLSLNGKMYSFIYLGWGSSIPGIAISINDLNFAQQMIDKYKEDDVILLAHNYMGNNGNRTSAGIAIYEQLVRANPQIKLVFSGHVNGSSSRVDYLDDNKDGLVDRRVFQLVTNFQEDDSLYGGSFIRRIGLDYVNHRLVFDLYSPFYNDTDVFSNTQRGEVGKHKAFSYEFDLNDSGYSLITYQVN
jgi:hypothetical protein